VTQQEEKKGYKAMQTLEKSQNIHRQGSANQRKEKAQARNVRQIHIKQFFASLPSPSLLYYIVSQKRQKGKKKKSELQNTTRSSFSQ
jgi:hypothetical protein